MSQMNGNATTCVRMSNESYRLCHFVMLFARTKAPLFSVVRILVMPLFSVRCLVCLVCLMPLPVLYVCVYISVSMSVVIASPNRSAIEKANPLALCVLHKSQAICSITFIYATHRGDI